MANILSQKFALNGSYAIYVFIGDFDDTPSAWSTSPNLVGTHAVFGAIDMTSSTTSKVMASKPGIQVTGSVPLTSVLLTKARAGEIADLAPATVEQYLTDNLHWRVSMFDNIEVAPEDVADLMVTVVTAQVKPAASSDEFPDWGDFVQLTHITQGKPGGC
jgi:tyrosinase